jgi:peptide/nickel transport system substrate-binding protein
MIALAMLGPASGAAGQPAAGEVVIAWHVTIAPSWFDPSTAPPQITPFGILYELHDALVRFPPSRRCPQGSVARPRGATPSLGTARAACSAV